MEEYADLNLVGYLYNRCFGGFSFSDNFVKRINEDRKGTGLNPIMNYCERRTDSDIIALLKEWGSEKSSGSCAKLEVCWIPAEFLKYANIHETGGREVIRVKYNEIYADLLKGFMEERKVNSALTLEDLEKRYAAAEAKIGRYHKFLSEFPSEEAVYEED